MKTELFDTEQAAERLLVGHKTLLQEAKSLVAWGVERGLIHYPMRLAGEVGEARHTTNSKMASAGREASVRHDRALLLN
jgi:hypothetical protein